MGPAVACGPKHFAELQTVAVSVISLAAVTELQTDKRLQQSM